MKTTGVDIQRFVVATPIIPQLTTIVYSGTTTIIFKQEQKEDVFSRDVIIEKNGFMTQTDKKYFHPSKSLTSRYSEKTVNTGFYQPISFSGATCISGATTINRICI